MPSDTETRWNPQQYAEQARFVSELGRPVVELLAPQPGERILDLGCGDGALTRKLQELGCHIVGVDSSPEMIQAAQVLGLDARVMSGHELPFAGEFDAVFTNAALHSYHAVIPKVTRLEAEGAPHWPERSAPRRASASSLSFAS